MAFEPKKEQIKKALGEKIAEWRVPTASLPKREEPEKVITSFTLDKKNKEKLARLAKANGYGKSTAAFLNDWIASVEE